MFKLLNFEMRKLIRQRSFYIILAVIVAMALISSYTAKLVSESAGIETTANGMSKLLSAVGSNSLTMVLGIFVSLFVCDDYVSGTIRNILTRGYTRFSIYAAKLIVVLFASVIMTVVCMGASYGIGTAFWGHGDISFDIEVVKLLLYQMAAVLAYAALYYAIVSVIQKVGASIAVCVILSLFVTVALKLADAALVEQELTVSEYWLENVIYSLNSTALAFEDIKQALIISACYFVGSLTVGWLAVMKREY